MTNKRHPAVTQALLWLAVVGLAALTPELATRWTAARAWAFQMDAEEGFILDQALALARGESIYLPIAQPPWVVGNYTPLLPWVYARWVGPQAGTSSLPIGRALIQVSVLVAAALLGWMAWLRTRRAWAVALTPLLWLVTYETHHWSAFVRVDFPALALTLGGLAVFIAGRGRAAMAASALLCAAGVYTRQTMLAAPAACAVALLLDDRRRARWWLGTFVGAAGGAFALLQWRTDGEFFRHTVLYNRNVMDWAGWRRLMKNEVWFFYRVWLVTLGVALAAAWGLRRRDRHGPVAVAPSHARRVIGLYAALSAASGLLAYAKVGAAPNYLLEPIAAAALWTTQTLATWTPRPDPQPQPRRRLHRLVAVLLVLGLLAHTGFMWHRRAVAFSSPTPDPARDGAAASALAQAVRRTDGDVLCEEPIFTLLARKPVLVQPFITTQLAREGRWDDAPLVEAIRQGRFNLLVVTEDLTRADAHHERYTRAVAEAVRAACRPAGTVVVAGLHRRYYVWRWASDTASDGAAP